MKILYFFLYLKFIFALLADPATQINAEPSGSGSTTLLTYLLSQVFWLNLGWRAVEIQESAAQQCQERCPL
jgi:uncharacterized membrane protein